MTDQWGTVVAKYAYDPWGNILSVKDGSGNDVSNNPTHRANINPIRYAGYRYDTETGLYYLLARYYDPATYRFLTKDPDGGDKDKPLTQNPYAYANGNPMMNVDPDGHSPLLILVLVTVVIVGIYLWLLISAWNGVVQKAQKIRKSQIKKNGYTTNQNVMKALIKTKEWKRLNRVLPRALRGLMNPFLKPKGVTF